MENQDNNVALNNSSLSLEEKLKLEKDAMFVQDFFLENYHYSPKQLKLDGAYNQVVYAPDIHTNSVSFQKGIYRLQEEAQGKNSVIIIGDTNDRREHLAGLYQNYNIPTESALEANYIAQKLSIEDAEAYSFISTIKKSYGNLENYIKMSKAMGHEVSETIEKDYHNNLRHYNFNNLEEKVEELFKESEFQAAKIQIDLLGKAVDYANAKVLAKNKAESLFEANLNAYNSGLGETIVIEEGGNHGSIYDTILFKKEYDQLVEGSNLSKSDKIIYNALELHGSIDLGTGADKFSFQIANNCPDNFPGLVGQIFNPIQLELLFPQTFDQTYTNNYIPSNYESLDENTIFMNSQDAVRMSGVAVNKDNKPENVDMVFLHDERGNVSGYEDTIDNSKRLTNLGLEVYLNHFVKKDKDGHYRIGSGHWHRGTNGVVVDDLWSQKKSRSYMAKFGNNGIFEEYNITPESKEFDYELFENIVNEELQRATQIYQNIEQTMISNQPGNTSDYNPNSDEKAA